MTMTFFDSTDDMLRDLQSEQEEPRSTLPRFDKDLVSKPHRCQSFPTSSAFLSDFELDSLRNVLEEYHLQKPVSADALYSENLETLSTDFSDDLTSDIALFNSCEFLICELEASLYSASLPKPLQRIEKVLVDAHRLEALRPTSPPRRARGRRTPKSFRRMRRCMSLGSVHAKVVDEEDDTGAESGMRLVGTPEPCQAALVAGGLARVVVQEVFRGSTRVPLRLRRLQERLASMLDSDWVLNPPNGCCAQYWKSPEQADNFGISSVSGLTNVADPLLSLPEPSSSEKDPGELDSQLSSRLMGMENFFHVASADRRNRLLQSNSLIISPIIPKEKRRGILLSQNNRCYGCGVYIETKYLGSLRFCEYYGRYFCSMCHSNTLMALPGVLVHEWSAAMFPVSCYARDLLRRLHHRPLLRSSDLLPPALLSAPGSSGRFTNRRRRKRALELLRDAVKLRRQAGAMVPFFKLCPDSASALFAVNKLPAHWLNSSDTWSLYDLISLARAAEGSLPLASSLIGQLGAALEPCVEHLAQCLRCRARGHLCEVCHSGRLLYPHFGQTQTLVCKNCSACFHQACFTALTVAFRTGSAVAATSALVSAVTAPPEKDKEDPLSVILGNENGDSNKEKMQPDNTNCPRCARLRKRKERTEDA